MPVDYIPHISSVNPPPPKYTETTTHTLDVEAVPNLSPTATAALEVAKAEIASLTPFSTSSSRQRVANKHHAIGEHLLSADESVTFSKYVDGYLAWRNRSAMKFRLYLGCTVAVVLFVILISAVAAVKNGSQ